jgi:hypothetical protein
LYSSASIFRNLDEIGIANRPNGGRGGGRILALGNPQGKKTTMESHKERKLL